MTIFDMKPEAAQATAVGSRILALAHDPISKVRHRRSWSLEEKLAIIAEVESSGDPVAVVARRHDMNANHLFNWIDRAKRGMLGRGSTARPPSVDEPPPEFIDLGVFTREQIDQAAIGSCVMEIELPGGIRMRVPAVIDPEALTRA
jgi:transposase-like protein